MTRVLIVEDDPGLRRDAASILTDAGFAPLTAADGDAALACLRADPLIVAVVLDLVLPDRDGMAVLEAMAREGIDIPAIVAIKEPTAAMVTDILRAGAADFIDKPVRPERLRTTLHNVLHRHRLGRALAAERHRRLGTPRLADFVAEAPQMQRAMVVANRARKSRLPVLIEGEPGTGRDFLARIIHAGSERAAKPFIAVRDGFADFAGACLSAQGGTLFVEEIGDLRPAAQEALARFLEIDALRLPGSARPQRLDIRLIASSSRRLLDLTRSGAFREDLFYRLNVLPIYLPSLRERPEDIEALVSRFITRFASELGREIAGIAPAALSLLANSPWPLNVRQLEGAVCRAVALAQTAWLEPIDFPDLLVQSVGHVSAREAVAKLNATSAPVHIGSVSFQRQETSDHHLPDRFLDGAELLSLADVERQLIGFALVRYEGRMSSMARALGIGRSTLYRKLRDYGLDGASESDAA